MTQNDTEPTVTTNKQSLLPFIFALLVLSFFAYLLFIDFKPDVAEEITPPLEIIEPPLTIIEMEQEPSIEQVKEQGAIDFVKALAKSEKAPIALTEEQDRFARHSDHIILPDLEHRATTIQQLIDDIYLADDIPITLNYTTESHTKTTLAELSTSSEDYTADITIITEDGARITLPLVELINQPDINLNAPITQVIQEKHTRLITKGELNSETDLTSSQAVIATINHGEQQVAIRDIIQDDSFDDNAIFYLHRVTERDVQGLWGIIQTGLIEKFREGLHIEGISLSQSFVQATIPADADEKLQSGLSSFLGKILNQKVDTSYIYNFSTKKMGRDPNIIHPGQQLVLIHFTTDELKEIYQNFSSRRDQGIKTFPISG